MLWRKDKPWEGRGSTSKGTENILKFKPTILTVGIPYEPAYNALQTAALKRERDHGICLMHVLRQKPSVGRR